MRILDFFRRLPARFSGPADLPPLPRPSTRRMVMVPVPGDHPLLPAPFMWTVEQREREREKERAAKEQPDGI